MKQKLLIALLVIMVNCINAQTDSIPLGSNSGAGGNVSASNTYGPMMTLTTGPVWNRHAYIYPSSTYSSLPLGSVINMISFPRGTQSFTFGALSGTVSFKIYMKNTTATDFGAANLDWTAETSSATLVYNGNSTDIISIIGGSYGLKKFPLSTNFVYAGGNIEFLFEYTQSSATTGEVVWGYDKTSNVSAYANNQAKYVFGTTNVPSSTTLSNSASQHPSMILYFSGTSCTGVPNAGTVPFIINACQGSYTALNVSGYSAQNGIKLKWQQASSPSGPWNAVNGGTADSLSTYLTGNLYATTYYRVKATCANSLDSAFSNVDTIHITHQPSTLPLIMGFNTNTSQLECLSQDQVRDTSILSTPITPSIVLTPSIANPTNTPTANVSPQEGDRFVSFNSYTCDPYDAIRLKMPELTTKGLSGVDMYYFYYQTNGHKASNDNITIQYSTDNKTWTSVPGSSTNITKPALDSTHNGWQKVFLSLPAAVANKDSIWIGFLFTSGYGYNILIDNVKIGATGTLPVKYLDFKAAKSGTFNKLSWTTYEEKDNSYFEIERSTDGKEFAGIGKQNAKTLNGTSNTELNYSFIDNSPLKGNNYYRIKQIDINGSVYYSEIVVINQAKDNALTIGRVYPNPSTDGKINLTVFAPEATTLTTTITDVAGKVIKQFNQTVIAGDNDLSINFSALQKGNYLIRTSSSKMQSNALMFEKR